MLLMPPDQGGAAEFVAQQLDVRLREHLRLRNNLLTEGTPGLSASLSRPLLCLFDRNFELSVVRQPVTILLSPNLRLVDGDLHFGLPQVERIDWLVLAGAIIQLFALGKGAESE